MREWSNFLNGTYNVHLQETAEAFDADEAGIRRHDRFFSCIYGGDNVVHRNNNLRFCDQLLVASAGPQHTFYQSKEQLEVEEVELDILNGHKSLTHAPL